MSPTELSEHESQTALPKPPTQKLLTEPEEPKKGSPLKMIIIVLVILAVVGGVAWKIRLNSQNVVVQGGRQAAQGDRPVPVTTALVEEKTMPIYLTALGTVTAYNTVTIKTRVDGQLLQVNVREGQAVKKGQLLAQIDPAPYAAALAQAEGTLIKDQANAANAQAQATRYTALADAGVVSKESMQLQVSSAGQVAGSIASDQAAIQAAKVNLAYTKIVSPIDGVVGLRQVDPGNIVHAGDASGLLVITQLQPISMIFTLPEDQLPQVQGFMKNGKTLPVEARDRSDANHIATGKLVTLDNQIDTTTGTVKAKVVFDNKDNALFPNQFVNARLILQNRENAIVIPSAALQTGSQGTFVYVAKRGLPPVDPNAPAGAAGGGAGRRRAGGAAGGAGGAAGAGAGGAAGAGRAGAGGAGAPAGPPADPYYVEARPVKVDVTEGTQVIIASGVEKGEAVVIDGQEKLRNLARVNPRDANAPLPGAGGRGGRGGRNGGAGGPGGQAGAAGAGAGGAAQSGAADSGSAAPAASGQAGQDAPRGQRGAGRGAGAGSPSDGGAGAGGAGGGQNGGRRRRDGGNGGGGTQQ